MFKTCRRASKAHRRGVREFPVEHRTFAVSATLFPGVSEPHALLSPVITLSAYREAKFSETRLGELWERARKSQAMDHFPLAACTICRNTFRTWP